MARTADVYMGSPQRWVALGRSNRAIASPWSCLIYLVASIVMLIYNSIYFPLSINSFPFVNIFPSEPLFVVFFSSSLNKYILLGSGLCQSLSLVHFLCYNQISQHALLSNSRGGFGGSCFSWHAQMAYYGFGISRRCLWRRLRPYEQISSRPWACLRETSHGD